MMRKFPAVILAALLCVPAQAWRNGLANVAPNSGGMLLNLAPTSYFAGYNPYLNWWQIGSTLTLVSSVNGTLTGQQIYDCPTKCSTPETYLDANGELVNPVPADVVSINRGFFTPVNFPQYQYEGTSFNNFAGQVWDVKWGGCAAPTVTVGGGLGAGGTSSFGSNSGTVTLGSSGYSNVALIFTMTAGCFANPPTKINVSQHQYAANVAACADGANPTRCFNPDWINDVKQFGILRLMDWMQTNGSGITDISQLADFNSTSLNRPFLAALSFASTISGGVLTVGSFNTGNANFAVGQTLVGTGIASGAVTISSLGSGTGGNGTYNLTCSGACPTISSEAIVGVPPVGANYSYGPKGGLHPSVACALSHATGAIIEYPIPIAATNQFVTDVATYFFGCGIKVKYSYGNENWNFGFLQFYYVSGQSQSNYSGYRAAQIFEIIYNVYGAANRSQWVGALGSQLASTAVTTSNINGAKAWISGGATHTLTQLVDWIHVAPYIGANYSGPAITNVTVGATPTVTAAAHGFTNGQVIKLFVTGGTMASVLNGNSVAAYATVSSVTTNTFVINIDTTGLTYAAASSGSNYAMDAILFKMADQSSALNISTPATYPTKFSFFAQQFSKAVLNGSASDASYGTLTISATGNLSNAAGAIPNLLQQHALIANSNGISLSEYEGGPGTTLVSVPQGGPVPNQLVEYLNIFQFDAGAVGDAVNTPANTQAVAYQALRNVNSAYSAQFNELQAQTQFGPWGALRFTPGDEGNPKWSALVAENVRGPYVDPTPAAPGSCSYVTSNYTTANSNTQTISSVDLGTANSGRSVIVGVAGQSSGGAAISSVVVDGSITLTQDVLDGSSVTALYSGAVPSGSGATHSVVITYVNSTFKSRGAFVYRAVGLSSPYAATINNGAQAVKISETKGACVISVGNYVGSAPNYDTLSSIPSVDGTHLTTAQGASAFFVPGFTSAIFSVNTGVSANQVVATYR